MAFDVTALTTAIAEGRVDETRARELLAKSQDLEIEIAKLLNPQPASKVAQTTTEAAVDTTGQA